MGRRPWPAGEGAVLGLGQLSWRCLGESSLSRLTDSWIRGEVWEVPERMRHLRKGLWSEGVKGDGSWVSPSLWIPNQAPLKSEEVLSFALRVGLHLEILAGLDKCPVQKPSV